MSYRKVASSSLSRLVARFQIFRRLMKGIFDPYVLWPLAKKFQTWIVDRSNSCDFTVFKGNFWISGSSASCSQGSQNANPLTNRFCGGALNVMFEGDINIPICGKFSNHFITNIYRRRATITRSWFETALNCKPRILDSKIAEFPANVLSAESTDEYLRTKSKDN